MSWSTDFGLSISFNVFDLQLGKFTGSDDKVWSVYGELIIHSNDTQNDTQNGSIVNKWSTNSNLNGLTWCEYLTNLIALSEEQVNGDCSIVTYVFGKNNDGAVEYVIDFNIVVLYEEYAEFIEDVFINDASMSDYSLNLISRFNVK